MNELSRDREIGFPMLDPVFGITPVTLGVERDGSQGWSVFRRCAPDSHFSAYNNRI